MYIQSATLDGVAYTKNWIDHGFFTEGKELVLTLGSSESAWGTQVADLPPSLGEYTGFNGTGAGNSTNGTFVRRSGAGLRYDRKAEMGMAVGLGV